MLTADSLDTLPLGFEVTADDIADMSGQNRIKGIHPLLAADPKSVVVLCTIAGGDYPDGWVNEDHKELIYCLEGRFDRGLGRKTYHKQWKTNRAVATSADEGYPVHVFWRPKKKTPFQYAGAYVFVDYVSRHPHIAFLLRRLHS